MVHSSFRIDGSTHENGLLNSRPIIIIGPVHTSNECRVVYTVVVLQQAVLLATVWMTFNIAR